MKNCRLAIFRVDVTPPVGHPLCAGWYGTARGIADPLYAMGIVLFGDEKPVVLCGIDWAEISNRSHIAWREQLATAAGTTADRVAVQCCHPHCTPWPDEEAEALVCQQTGVTHVMDPVWCAQALGRVSAAVKTASAHTVTHIGLGRAKVDQVASNRRILGADGKIKAVRYTKTRDPAIRAEPEGLIDPWLRTISFWNETQKLAALHYYAVHPTSYDTDAMVTPDFIGLARERRIREDAGIPHIQFNGCAGDITPGKYNDGAPENRPVLTDRVYQAMIDSERDIERIPLHNFEWRTQFAHLPPREDMVESNLLAVLRDSTKRDGERSRAALMLAYLRRTETPIAFSSLMLNECAGIVHLPGEAFIEYQLYAQAQRPDLFVAVASYGDCGPGYICLEKSFAEGGYEPNDSFCAPQSEMVMKRTIAALLQ